MNKKIRVILVILIVILLVLILRTTFSKYANEATAEINQDVGKWIIKINGTDITTTGNSTRFNIDNFVWNWQDSPHVKYPKVAPGMKGYFDLIIDPTDTDVSLTYTIEIDDSSVSLPNVNIKILDITELNGKQLEFTTNPDGPEIIKRTKMLEEIKSKDETRRLDTIRVQIEWENNEVNNESDSKLGSVANNVVQIPILVNAIQYTGI